MRVGLQDFGKSSSVLLNFTIPLDNHAQEQSHQSPEEEAEATQPHLKTDRPFYFILDRRSPRCPTHPDQPATARLIEVPVN